MIRWWPILLLLSPAAALAAPGLDALSVAPDGNGGRPIP